MAKCSVIIPCYFDDGKLARLLRQLQQLPNRPCEIIVVDAANSIHCLNICNRLRVKRLVDEPCRGRQLRAGAIQAKGDVLWFLHADAQLSADPVAAISSALARGAVGGYFRFHFSGPRTWQAVILEPAIALRCRFGVPYGDQGIFIKRAVYQQTGGHAPWPLFEEVPLVQFTRRCGKFLALSEPVFVDSRRWRRDGWWRRTWYNRKLAWRFMCGATPEELAARYHFKINP